MYQTLLTNQLIFAQAKAVEMTQILTQFAFNNAQQLAEINQAVARNVLAAAQEASGKLLVTKGSQQLTASPEEGALHVMEPPSHDARDSLLSCFRRTAKATPVECQVFFYPLQAILESTLLQYDQAHSTVFDTLTNIEGSSDSTKVNVQSGHDTVMPTEKIRKAE